MADFDVWCVQEVADNFPGLEGNDDRDQFAELGALQAWSLLAEPKELELPSPASLQVSLAGDGSLALRNIGPVVDLWLSDEAGCRAFGKNLLTLPEAGTTYLPYSGSGRGLKARSLAGEHAIALTRAPL